MRPGEKAIVVPVNRTTVQRKALRLAVALAAVGEGAEDEQRSLLRELSDVAHYRRQSVSVVAWGDRDREEAS